MCQPPGSILHIGSKGGLRWNFEMKNIKMLPPPVSDIGMWQQFDWAKSFSSPLFTFHCKLHAPFLPAWIEPHWDFCKHFNCYCYCCISFKLVLLEPTNYISTSFAMKWISFSLRSNFAIFATSLPFLPPPHLPHSFPLPHPIFPIPPPPPHPTALW